MKHERKTTTNSVRRGRRGAPGFRRRRPSPAPVVRFRFRSVSVMVSVMVSVSDSVISLLSLTRLWLVPGWLRLYECIRGLWGAGSVEALWNQVLVC